MKRLLIGGRREIDITGDGVEGTANLTAFARDAQAHSQIRD
jgi:hypothetical protein